MQNSSDPHPAFFTLGYGQLTSIRYFYCLLVLVGFLLNVVPNSLIIVSVIIHKTLQEPVYIFISALCFNGMLESVYFYPGIFVTLLYKVQTISYSFCLLQTFLVHLYGCFELTTLTAMAYDRYVCICNPLRYNTIMSHSTVYKILAGSWTYSIVAFGTQMLLTYRLPLCGSEILKIYCDNWSIVRLSCIDTSINNIYGLFIVSTYIGMLLILIMYSYIEILKVCARSSQAVIAKALQTCTPQLITTINLMTAACFDIFLYRYIPTIVPYEFRLFISLEYLVVSPILNAFVYGLKMSELKAKIFKTFNMKTTPGNTLKEN
uniref:Olfactory receptor n=1 Tax=Xenopus tropicalis TaxID=8364 RepID=A0A1B8Y8R4_XENTR|eukprot:XP_004912481.2 PREDICTED: olfactory receptor 51I2-like [Xenopus tropicalis]